MGQRLALVGVENVAYHFDALYGYLITDELLSRVLPGVRVSVPFGRGDKARLGFVYDICDPEPSKRYKSILSVLDDEPLLNSEMLETARFLKDRTFCTYYEAAKVQLPAGFNYKMHAYYAAAEEFDVSKLTKREREVYNFLKSSPLPVKKEAIEAGCGFDKSVYAAGRLVALGAAVRYYDIVGAVGSLVQKYAELSVDAELLDIDSLKLTNKQRELFKVVCDVGAASVEQLCRFAGVSRAVMTALEAKGLVRTFDHRVYRIPAVPGLENKIAGEIVLNDEQQAAYNGIYEKYKNGGGVCLLHGVTGSGKTAVYLKLIDSVLSDGRQVIVMVPEIALTAQLIAMFRQRYSRKVAVFHSALSMGERRDEYSRVKNGEARLVVGTRSAVFAPFDNLGLIVMDEEQEHCYKSESGVRYHAADVSRFRIKKHGALLLLASATPAVESYSRAKKGIYSLFTLKQRYADAALPKVTVVDMKRDRAAGNKYSISLLLNEKISQNLENKKQTILLINRRGYNTFATCSSCSSTVTCPSCSIAMTYHITTDKLMCHYCGYTRDFTTRCEYCSKNTVRYMGYGTQRVEQELEKLFPTARVLRLDADSASTRHSLESALSAFSKGEYDILLGTQMVAKGLDFPHVTLVGVLNPDARLYFDDFRSGEVTFDLITQVVGRGGRGEYEGHAVIQTLMPENDIIRLASRQDYESFFESELAIRRQMIYPPFCDICCVMTVSEHEASALSAARAFAAAVEEMSKSEFNDLKLIVLGPVPPAVLKIQNKFRYRLIIKTKNTGRFRQMISQILIKLSKSSQFDKVSFIADINPLTFS